MRKTAVVVIFMMMILLFSSFIVGDQSVHGQPIPNGIVSLVPITFANNQTIPTPSPFQLMLTVDSSAYASHEAANLQNVEFFYANGTIIPSWLESGNTNTSRSTIYWLKLTERIQGDSSIRIYMGFASPTMDLFNPGETGEAPQLSPSYSEYDDGVNVFPFYDNFNGTVLNSQWDTYVRSGSVSVDNGVTLNAPGSADLATIYTAVANPAGGIFEAYISSLTGTETYELVGQNVNPPNSATGWLGYANGYLSGGIGTPNQVSNYLFRVNDGGENFLTSYNSATLPQVVSLVWSATGDEATDLNYGSGESSTDSLLTLPSHVYFSITSYANLGGGNSIAALSWARARIYPPNGVMPSASFGQLSLETSTTSISTSSSSTSITGSSSQESSSTTSSVESGATGVATSSSSTTPPTPPPPPSSSDLSLLEGAVGIVATVLVGLYATIGRSRLDIYQEPGSTSIDILNRSTNVAIVTKVELFDEQKRSISIVDVTLRDEHGLELNSNHSLPQQVGKEMKLELRIEIDSPAAGQHLKAFVTYNHPTKNSHVKKQDVTLKPAANANSA